MIAEFSTLTMIARRFGVSTLTCRQWLVQLDLSTATGGPTVKARHLGLAQTARADPDHSQGRRWVWHIANTAALLETAGHCQLPKESPVRARLLVGPFAERPSGTVGREILNGHGEVFCWALGDAASGVIVRLLNRADRQGGLPPA